MSYYRAALAAAYIGDLTAAGRLLGCSEAIREEGNTARLSKLIKAQKLIVREHNIRGLNCAKNGRYRKASGHFRAAIRLDCGNILAKRALIACDAAKKRWIFW